MLEALVCLALASVVGVGFFAQFEEEEADLVLQLFDHGDRVEIHPLVIRFRSFRDHLLVREQGRGGATHRVTGLRQLAYGLMLCHVVQTPHVQLQRPLLELLVDNLAVVIHISLVEHLVILG